MNVRMKVYVCRYVCMYVRYVGTYVCMCTLSVVPLQDFADSKGKILYGLYAIVVHGGSLHGGHYTACVRQRPLKKSLLKQQPDVSQQTYNAKAAEDGQWYYTSDSHVSGCGFDRVKGSQAYLLFYELLPVKSCIFCLASKPF